MIGDRKLCDNLGMNKTADRSTTIQTNIFLFGNERVERKFWRQKKTDGLAVTS